MSRESNFKPVLDWLGGICAFLTVIVYALLIIHGNWAFLPEWLFNVLVVCKTWATLVVVSITGIEFTSSKGFLVRLLFYILMAAVVVFMFFPDTWNEFVGIVNDNI